MNTDVDGSTLVVHSRLSLNLAGGTLEQVLSNPNWNLNPHPNPNSRAGS